MHKSGYYFLLKVCAFCELIFAVGCGIIFPAAPGIHEKISPLLERYFSTNGWHVYSDVIPYYFSRGALVHIYIPQR